MKNKDFLYDDEEMKDLNIDLDAEATSANANSENDVVIKEWNLYIQKETDKYREQLSKHYCQKFKLDFLKRIAGRIDESAPLCKTCKKNKMKMTMLVKGLEDIVKNPNDKHTEYFKQLKAFADHLQITHKLLKEHQYMTALTIAGLITGMVAGLIIGQAVDPRNYFFTVFASIVIGGGLGAEAERLMIMNARKKGKLI